MDEPKDSISEIIELYKKDIDTTLLDEMLRLTVEERIQRLQEFEQFREELQEATRRANEPIW